MISVLQRDRVDIQQQTRRAWVAGWKPSVHGVARSSHGVSRRQNDGASRGTCLGAKRPNDLLRVTPCDFDALAARHRTTYGVIPALIMPHSRHLPESIVVRFRASPDRSTFK